MMLNGRVRATSHLQNVNNPHWQPVNVSNSCFS